MIDKILFLKTIYTPAIPKEPSFAIPGAFKYNTINELSPLSENFSSCKFSSDKIQINPLGLRQDEGYLYLDHWRPR